jgi:hypothetical protein
MPRRSNALRASTYSLRRFDQQARPESSAPTGNVISDGVHARAIAIRVSDNCSLESAHRRVLSSMCAHVCSQRAIYEATSGR